MTYFIREANSQTLNFNLLLQRRSGDWSKDPWLFILRLLVRAAVQSKRSYFKLLYFCILTIIRKSKQPGEWKLPRDLRTISDPHDYSQFSKPESSQAQHWGRGERGREKQNKTESSTFVFPTWQPAAFDTRHLQFVFILLCTFSTSQSGFPVILWHCEPPLKEIPQEFLLLWEIPHTQFNLIISWNKSSCINFYDPMHF